MNAIIPFLVLGLVLQEGDATYLLGSGRQVRGRVLSIDGSEVVLEVRVPGGRTRQRHGLDQFTERSGYRVRAAVARADSPDDRVGLARYAAEHGLQAVARRELRLARRLAGDPDLAKDLEALIDERSAEALGRLARESVAAGRLGPARRYVSLLLVRYPGTRTAAQKNALLAMVDEAEKRAAAKRARERRAATDARLEKEAENLLEPIRREVELGRAANRRGLLTSKHYTRARRWFLRAVRHLERALRQAERTRKKHGGGGLVGRVAIIVEAAKAALADAWLNAASISTIQGSFTQAVGYVNRVLLLDSRNKAALDMRARIEIAVNQAAWH